MSKLIVGCGYLGSRVAELWRAAGETVFCVTRSEDRGNQLRARGLTPVVADITQPATLSGLPQAGSVLFAVGFDRSAGRSIREVYVRGLQNVLDRLGDAVERFIYVSSTGVYAQTDGGWIDEDAPCEPTREGGQACLEAERLLMSHPLGRRANVLRLAGIYGPGRIPRRQDICSGQPLSFPSGGYLNLIHVDDAARIVCLVDRAAPLAKTYHVADGHPVVRADYYRELARLFDAPLFDTPSPQFAPLDADATAKASRAESSKRISNRRLLEDLPVVFKYPSYREGLRAIIESESSC